MEGIPKVFVIHGKHHEVSDYFVKFIKALGMEPLVVERLPSYGMHPGQKVEHYMRQSDCVLVIVTPDERVENEFHPRGNVVHEIALAQSLMSERVIYLKEKTAILPSNIQVTYIPFELGRPDQTILQLVRELRGLGVLLSSKKKVIPTVEIKEKLPITLREDLLRDLMRIDPGPVQRAVSRIVEMSESNRRTYIEKLTDLSYNEKKDIRWAAGYALYNFVEVDPELVPLEVFKRLAKDKEWTVRSSASYAFYALAKLRPMSVPVEVIRKLAKSTEDWYVYDAAISTLKLLANTRPEALDVLIDMTGSKNKYDRRLAAKALLDLSKRYSGLIPVGLIEKMVEDGDVEVRIVSKKILERIKGK